MSERGWIIRFPNSKSSATLNHATGEPMRFYTQESAEEAIKQERNLLLRYGYQPVPMIAGR